MHVRRDSNPQPAVLETAALPIELLTYLTFGILSFKFLIPNSKLLFCFLVWRVLIAEAAILFILDSAGLLSLVFCGRIISLFADCAFECNYVSHIFPYLASLRRSTLIKRHPAYGCLVKCSELTTGFEPVTYALPRRCSTS